MNKFGKYYCDADVPAEHGEICHGCGKCAHCPPDAGPESYHLHGWRYKIYTEEIFVSKKTLYWALTSDTFVSDDHGTISAINFHITAINIQDEELNWDDTEIIGRANSYEEALDMFEEHLNLQKRTERMRAFK